MMKLFIVSVTHHTRQNRVSDTIMHVTFNTINGVGSVHTPFLNINIISSCVVRKYDRSNREVPQHFTPNNNPRYLPYMV